MDRSGTKKCTHGCHSLKCLDWEFFDDIPQHVADASIDHIERFCRPCLTAESRGCEHRLS